MHTTMYGEIIKARREKKPFDHQVTILFKDGSTLMVFDTNYIIKTTEGLK